MSKTEQGNVQNSQDELKEAIKAMMEEKHMSQELVHSMIENTIKAAYKRKFGSDENCYIEIADDNSKIEVFIKKTVVPDGEKFDALSQISLSEAKELDENAELGDELLEPVDVKTFDRLSVHSGKQRFKQNTRDAQKNILYSEFKAKEGEIIVGYVQTTDSKTGDVYVDLGNGKVGRLLKALQSPIESYKKDDKIYCYVEAVRVNERGGGVDIVLSRSSKELVRKFLELKIPEIQNGSIEIHKIVRQAGYKTKVAVYATRENIDPVGTCIGLKGNKIQGIISELSGEKIDILEYNDQLEIFIANSLTPATIRMVRIIDYELRKAIAVVDEKDLSFAIGRGGLNVQLANKLTDWLIDIKTESQYKELDLDKEIKENVERLYDNMVAAGQDEYAEENEEVAETVEEVEEQEDGELLFENLPLSDKIKQKIAQKGVRSVEEFAEIYASEDIIEYFAFTTKEYKEFMSVLQDYVEIVDEDN